MTEILDENVFSDTDIIESIKRLNETRRRVQLSTIMTDLHENDMCLNMNDYSPLVRKLCAMRSRKLIIWENDSQSIKADDIINLM